MKRTSWLIALLLLILFLVIFIWPRRSIAQHPWFEQFDSYPLVISHADDTGQGLWPGNTLPYLEGVAGLGAEVGALAAGHLRCDPDPGPRCHGSGIAVAA